MIVESWLRWLSGALTFLVALYVCAEPHPPSSNDRRTAIQKAFERPSGRVATRFEATELLVESDGLPDHEMMVGIRAWQQQVPLPQSYVGENAWRVPLTPRPADHPRSTKDGFFRGAIAIAVNGVPIFNPIKNDGRTDTFLAGELDEHGGHAGRADDYHYHIAPIFLNDGDPARPIAFALDGYPLYGLLEPDGSSCRPLDELGGHEDAKLGYHYHATTHYPYVNGGFHGLVAEKDGQVDPQPAAHPIRESTQPLPGAKITRFHADENRKNFELGYEVLGNPASIRYSIVGDRRYRFEFEDADGTTHVEEYPNRGKDKKAGGPTDKSAADRKPWIEEHLREMDSDADGRLTRDELLTETLATFQGYDRDSNGSISTTERDAEGGVRSAMGGFVRAHWQEIDSNSDDLVTPAELKGTALAMFEKSDRDGDDTVLAGDSANSHAEAGTSGKKRAASDRKNGDDRSRGAGGGTYLSDVPDHPFDIVLCRPTTDSITVSIMTSRDEEGRLEYARLDPTHESSGLTNASFETTPTRPLRAGVPTEFELSHLQPGARYEYRLQHRGVDTDRFEASEPHRFALPKEQGRPFTFVVQADSHLDEGTTAATYRRTLSNEAKDQPDFVIDLGDTFMTDKFRDDFHDAAPQYLAQRYYLGQVASSSVLFLVLGNHDGESRWIDTPGGPGAGDMPHWANRMRKQYFPNPEPDSFYTGNSRPDPLNGLLQDYYSFQWGDALFVVLDPFLATPSRGASKDDPWSKTLGDVQFRWLESTLSRSSARFKFVFIHHLVGGIGKNSRGGAEAARLFEWGGRDTASGGKTAFAEHRPGLSAPIHDLLVKAKVSAVFHGHDHFFAKQELDGIVYQLVPQPSHPASDPTRMASEYGYESGTFLSSPGHIRVTVGEKATVEFVSSKDSSAIIDASYVLEPSSPSDQEPAHEQRPQPPAEEKRPKNREKAPEEGPEAALSVILGRPTANSITANVLSAAAIDAHVEYGLAGTTRELRTAIVHCPANTPSEIDLDDLSADSAYEYRLVAAPTNGSESRDSKKTVDGSFHTQRAAGRTFQFAVQGDSHPERAGKMYDAELYSRTLNRVAKSKPDFYITLGDDFSIERLIARGNLRREDVEGVYAHQRGFLGTVGRSAPLFLVNGNHEEAARYLLDGTDSNPAVLAGRARTRFFSLPGPGAFYSGDEEEVEHVGLLRDYYAWTWGDALFVVIDPYWHSPVQVDADAGSGGGKGAKKGKGGSKRDMWAISIGDAQYHWLERTLGGSHARYKFVFAHHVLGTGRGGVEEADLYEWGGKDPRGDFRFEEKRPGWSLPIHALMAKNRVTIFFQGHDHLFAHQEKDGVVYQETPNPADSTYQAFNREAYRAGDVLPNSGHLRVTVSPANVRVEYVRSYLGKDETNEHLDGETAFSYVVTARTN